MLVLSNNKLFYKIRICYFISPKIVKVNKNSRELFYNDKNYSFSMFSVGRKVIYAHLALEMYFQI